MVKALLGSLNCGLVCFFFLISLGFLQAQEQKTNPEIEKIYLHTDRTRYFIGEDLWYKAYEVRAIKNILYDNSNLLYVELVSSDSKIIARNKTNIEMGLGYGDFKLADSLGVKPGVYQIRAYTNWDRNFGEDFVFKKNIEIIDAFELNSKVKKTQSFTVESKSIVNVPKSTKQLGGIVDFFPEEVPFLKM